MSPADPIEALRVVQDTLQALYSDHVQYPQLRLPPMQLQRLQTAQAVLRGVVSALSESATPAREVEEPVVSHELRMCLDMAYALVGDVQRGAVPRRDVSNVLLDVLHTIKEAMLLAYPDTPTPAREGALAELLKPWLAEMRGHFANLPTIYARHEAEVTFVSILEAALAASPRGLRWHACTQCGGKFADTPEETAEWDAYVARSKDCRCPKVSSVAASPRRADERKGQTP